MEQKEFKLDNEEKIEKFDNFLNQYAEKKGFDTKVLPLIKIYHALQDRVEKSKIFTAFLDIKINFVLLSCDIRTVGGTWNEKFSKGKLEGGSILDSQEKFFGKMDIQRFITSFVLRCRALWDKIMGLLILMMIPKKYEDFCGAKRKKREFKKIMSGLKMPGEAIGLIDKIISNLDDLFRTAEAHGTGILRKYTFTMEPFHENPQFQLINHWNAINCVVSSLKDMPGIELRYLGIEVILESGLKRR